MKPTTLALLFSCLLLSACAHRVGPTPRLTQPAASPPSVEGKSILRVKVRADFPDMAGLSRAAKVQHLLDDIKFSVESVDGMRVDAVAAAVVMGTLKTQKMSGEYADRLELEVVIFPLRVAGMTVRLRAKSQHEGPDDDPGYIDMRAPEAARGQPVPVAFAAVKLEPEEKDGPLIRVSLDRDAPVALRVWHYLAGKVHAMERRGTRFYERRFKDEGFADHIVFMDMGDRWLSAPAKPQ